MSTTEPIKSSGYTKLSSFDSFGAIDAENDIRLLKYFIETDSLKRLLESKKSIVIGRKGSGKTAIYKYILSKTEALSTGLLFRDYPWKIHDKFKNIIVSEKESYVNSWLFLIYIEFIKIIVKDIDSYSKREKRKVKRLAKWLRRYWGSSDFEYKRTMNPEKKRWSWSLNPQVLGNGLGSLSKVFVNEDNLGESLSVINNKLHDIVLELFLPGKRYQLLFDELDLGYNPADSQYKLRIIGLLFANYDIYNKLTAKNSNVISYVFLRSDIYELLDFQDKNKITDNIVEVLQWDANGENSNLSLKRLISKRIRENLITYTDDFNKNWKTIFDNKNIGPNQLKWNYIIARTFIRPRDLIKFLNLAHNEAKKRKSSDKKSVDLITNDDIHSCRKEYSRYLYEELRDEVLSKYPLFDNYLEILRDVHYTSYDYDQFLTSFNSIKSRMEIDSDADTILERLYEFSIIGFYKPGGGGYGGSTYCFEYSEPLIKFNPKAKSFKIHIGFKEYLELIEG